MSYEFNSKYKKTNGFSPDEELNHQCCHHPKQAALKKALSNQDVMSGSGSAQSDQYSYKSRYSQAALHPELQHQCCDHEDIVNQTADLQSKNAQSRQQKSLDIIRKKLEEEQKKGP